MIARSQMIDFILQHMTIRTPADFTHRDDKEVMLIYNMIQANDQCNLHFINLMYHITER